MGSGFNITKYGEKNYGDLAFYLVVLPAAHRGYLSKMTPRQMMLLSYNKCSTFDASENISLNAKIEVAVIQSLCSPKLISDSKIIPELSLDVLTKTLPPSSYFLLPNVLLKRRI